ncbi:VOC family protein [Kribbella sp. CA-293567]|uniref:VOC family protein n=1 Tax=Kribbella sp. CA-293567 TaxID=3002436 RepID=UPI0022DD9741|nr:VOC family protein [Kribbella sp. CA-293567]WBQ02455.1 VOC family protein [Kribbella sp. CA-293567]
MNDVVIRPLRFTDQLPALRAFFETLGLRSRIESERGGWVDLVAGRGMVALHSAAGATSGVEPGETRLAFEADDIEELLGRFQAAGYDDASIVDEAFGRVLTASGPDGTELWIDERSKDLYGYKLHEAHPDLRWSVTPVLEVADHAGWERLLGVIGGDSSELVKFCGAAGGFGVRIELTTTESLVEVGERLARAGRSPELDEGVLTVVDPDGQSVRVSGQ